MKERPFFSHRSKLFPKVSLCMGVSGVFQEFGAALTSQ